MIKSTVRIFTDMFKYRGRFTRTEFWLGYLGTSLVTLVFVILVLYSGVNVENVWVIIISILFALLVKYAILVAAAKRISDAGYPWYLIFMDFFPIFGQIAVLILLCLPTSDTILSK